MMVDHSKLSKEERERRIRGRACLYCGGAGHFASKCPVKGQHPLVSWEALVGVVPIDSSTKSRTCLPVTLDWSGGSRKTSALLVSGAEEFFGCWSCHSMGHSPGRVSPSGQIAQRPEDWPQHPSHCPPQAPDIQEPSRDHLSFYHRHTPLPCRSGPSVDSHPQSGIELEKAENFGLEPILFYSTHLFLLLGERRPRTWRRFSLSTMTLVRVSLFYFFI